MTKKILIFISFLLPSFLYSQVVLNEFADGFNSVVDIASAGDDRLFIVEQNGEIQILENGNTLPTPFLNIDNLVTNSLDERGLLGLAFHPDYANNGYFYVNYSDNSGDNNIARYTRDNANPNLADPNSGVVIMTIEQPEWNHNGGCLKFGPDGYLYIGMGDGGSGGDPWNNAQNNQELLGKMLRIDVDNGSPYGIPTDNPFVNDNNVLDEIWATGLRNPWRYSFDRQTGDLWIGDVGQSGKEEIDFQPASSTGGENYGWKCYEGTDTYSNCNGGPYTDPIFEVQHQGFSGPCSITGGFVYRGTESPDLVGKYICTDYCSGNFYLIEPNGSGGFNGQDLGVIEAAITTFGEDNNGELYCASYYGTIYKISSNVDPCLTATPPTFTVDQNVLTADNINYNAYQWVLDGNDIAGATDPTYTALASGNYSLKVIDNNNCDLTSTAQNVTYTNIKNIADLSSLLVTPNPFEKNISLEITVENPIDLELEIMDNLGQSVFSKKININTKFSETLSLEHLSKGIYYLNLKSGDDLVTQKIVKQ